MQTTKIERVRGVIDALPQDCVINHTIITQLRQAFATYGYQPIEVPIIEYTDLYLRKSGEDIIDRLYDFVYRNRRLCLRPEMTASVMRAYVDNFEGQPLPIRLSYAGPVFRYEQPEQARYRQFTQIGIELIGAAGSMADAEAIWVACQGLEQVGLKNYQVVIGHIGVLNRFLNNLDLEDRLRSLLLSNMELLKQEQGKQQVAEFLADLYPDLQTASIPEAEDDSDLERSLNPKRLINLFRGMNNEEAKTVLLDLLESLNIGLEGNREPGEIAERLLIKLKRPDQTPKIRPALNFMSELSQLKGDPEAVLAEGAKVLAHYGLDEAPLNELRAIAQMLYRYNLDPKRICLDLGLSRGLQYYTGMVFEIHHTTLAGDRQLCGGGRYDDLVGVLGGNSDTPATGFAYGLERLRLALDHENVMPLNSTSAIDVVVVPLGSEHQGYAIQVAERLRNVGIQVALNSSAASSAASQHYAEKHGIPFSITVEGLEQIILYTTRSQTQQPRSVAEVADQIHQFKQSHYHE
jgi:histidyl-tRNA synthetase